MATQAEVDALRSAAARGILKVRFADGREVTYATPEQMLTTASRLEQQVAGDPFERTTYTDFRRD
jgi:hypothetical protein